MNVNDGARRTRKWCIVVVMLLCAVICIVSAVIHIRNANAKSMEEQLQNPEGLFNGTFDIDANSTVIHGEGDTEIHIRFSNENIGYDEKHLVFQNEALSVPEKFNYYYIKYPGEHFYEEGSEELRTIWHLCRYEQNNSLRLLNEKNKVIGRISVRLGEENWLGKRAIKYYWCSKGKVVRIYKCAEQSYGVGTQYLQSKYYSGIM